MDKKKDGEVKRQEVKWFFPWKNGIKPILMAQPKGTLAQLAVRE